MKQPRRGDGTQAGVKRSGTPASKRIIFPQAPTGRQTGSFFRRPVGA